MHVVKFFTYPPKPYPYVIVNSNKPQFSMVKYAKEVIVDSGVEIFRNPNVKDYPRNHVNKMLKIYSRIKQFVRDVWIVVPDYPDDYHPKSLWIDENRTNIERTIDNILNYTEKYKNVNWIIPVQGHNKKPESILRSINLLKEFGIIDKFDYFAIANLCVESDVEIMYRTIKLARENLRDKKLHVFGLRLNALKKIYPLIDSFDSMAWTRPVDSSLNANFSCKNKEQRIRFFDRWLEKYLSIVNNNTLDNWLAP